MNHNTSKKLIIISGLPGSGKSTRAKGLVPKEAIFCTDDYPNLYEFKGDEVIFNGGEKEDGEMIIALAHEWNQRRAAEAMKSGMNAVVIPNTNTQLWEFAPYLDLAREYGYEATRWDIFDAGLSNDELAKRNVHGVPTEIIARMREFYELGTIEELLTNCDPRKPWLRS